MIDTVPVPSSGMFLPKVRFRSSRLLRAILVAFILFVTPVIAHDVGSEHVDISVDEIAENRYLEVIRTLDRQGYQIRSVSRTLLNRIRILAVNQVQLREIIFSQSGGLVLRDTVLEVVSP
jgi:hypothetical protein